VLVVLAEFWTKADEDPTATAARKRERLETSRRMVGYIVLVVVVVKVVGYVVVVP